MFHQHYRRCKDFVCRLIILRVPFNKRLLTMSIPNLSEESSKRLKGRARLQSNADRRGADPSEGLTTCSIVHEHPARKFTEEEMDIHRTHREACEVRPSLSDPLLPCWCQSDHMINYNSVWYVICSIKINLTCQKYLLYKLAHFRIIYHVLIIIIDALKCYQSW